LPQVIKTWKSRSAKDLSLGMFSFFCFGVLLWLIYGIYQHDVPVIGANLDPSHLFWQQMDPLAVIRKGLRTGDIYSAGTTRVNTRMASNLSTSLFSIMEL